MKKIFFPAMAAMALGLASCSSDEPTSHGGGIDLSKGGYVKLSINLPTASQSRAVTNGENDQFDDGLAAEYSVKNAQLILFTGTSETAATFHSAYKLSTSMAMDGSTQITSTTKIVQKVNDTPARGEKLFALVVLNNNGETTVEDDNTLKVGTTNFNGTFADFQAKISSASTSGVSNFASDVKNKGIFMTNAPLANVQGGAKNPNTTEATSIKTLADVTDHISKTEAEAQAKPAINVYVERGVAKVTMEGNKSGKLSGNEFKNEKEVSYKVVGWALDVTNKSSFLVRHVAPNWNTFTSNFATANSINTYRFIGNALVGDGLYRTYWGTDPNYDQTYNAADFTIQPATFNGYTDKFDDANPQYCYENTFDVANQRQNRTTRALVKVQLTLKNGTEGEDLYTLNGDRSVLFSETNLEDRIKTAVAHAQGKQTVTIATDGIETVQVDNDKSTYKVNKVTTSEGEISTKDLEYVNNEIGTITKYDGGIAYYPIRIKHFGDSATPWNATNAGVTTTDVYNGNNESQYLGRYGVLRNNWYNLAVTGIAGVGTPRTPDTSDDSDDELHNYISVRINILSWAKRQQNADL